MSRIRLVAIVLLIAACARGSSTSGVGEAAKPAAPALPAGVTVEMIARGDSLYSHNACQRCHGPFGKNGPNGPALAKGDSAKWMHSDGSFEGIVATIIAGVPREKLVDKTRRFQMNPRGSNPPLSDADIRAVAAYIWKLNHL
jgi:mono/diheme cytochrome c family protein